ncbi:hypothetical protein Dimus_000856 [Dionaea muscipula]
MHTAACKEFYANLTVFIYKKKEIAKSIVKGVEIEFDSMKLASILDVPGHTGISEYIKEVWEESNSGYSSFDSVKEPASSGVDPSGPSGHLPEAVMNKLQVEFERARANRFQADSEKAQDENAILLALLQQAQFKPKP